MKKILFNIVAVCMSFNVFASNDQHAEYLDLATKIYESVNDKQETNCFILKRENIEIKKTEFSLKFCIVNDKHFTHSSVSFHEYVNSVTKKEENGSVTVAKNLKTIKSYDSIEVFLNRIKNGNLILKLSYEYQMITGWREFKDENGEKIELPLTKRSELVHNILFEEKGEKIIYKTKELGLTLELL